MARLGNCGDVPPGDFVPILDLQIADNGESYAAKPVLSPLVSVRSLATVSYSEYNKYDDDTYLKVAQQHFMN
jgi:hypothetical protein